MANHLWMLFHFSWSLHTLVLTQDSYSPLQNSYLGAYPGILLNVVCDHIQLLCVLISAAAESLRVRLLDAWQCNISFPCGWCVCLQQSCLLNLHKYLSICQMTDFNSWQLYQYQCTWYHTQSVVIYWPTWYGACDKQRICQKSNLNRQLMITVDTVLQAFVYCCPLVC